MPWKNDHERKYGQIRTPSNSSHQDNSISFGHLDATEEKEGNKVTSREINSQPSEPNFLNEVAIKNGYSSQLRKQRLMRGKSNFTREGTQTIHEVI